MKFILLLATLGIMSCAVPACAEDASAVFPKAGFSIKPPDTAAGKAPQVVAMFHLAPSGGFSPNVNVLALPAPKDMATFIEATKKELQGIKGSIVEQRSPDANTWVIEYKGVQGGRELHFYARAAMKGGTVILATATAAESQWAAVGEELKSSVDSLRAR
jgi:hypothetical protein